MSRKTKGILKKIGLVALGVGAVGAVGLGAKTAYDYLKNDLMSIHPTFEVGGLGNDGEYVKDESTLYTKNLFACEGLFATIDFDSDISYQFFYYDINHNFIESSDVYTKGVTADVPLNGAYARVEITPLNDEDGKISLKERVTYPSQLNLKVSKKAESNVNKKFMSLNGNLMEVVNSPLGLNFVEGRVFDVSDLTFKQSELSNVHVITSDTLLNLKNSKYLNWERGNDLNLYNVNISLYLFDDNLDFISTKSFDGKEVSYKVDVTNASYCIVFIAKQDVDGVADFGSANVYYPTMFYLSNK